MSLTYRNFEQYFHESFLEAAEDYENGNRDAADVWAQFRAETEILEKAVEDRKAWGNENKDAVMSEFDKYGKDGYKGYTVSEHRSVRYDYKHIPEWAAHIATMKQIEETAKAAIKIVGNGGEGADTDSGEIFRAAKMTESYSLKTTKTKR